MTFWGVTPVDSPTTVIMSSKWHTAFGTEAYTLELTDLEVRKSVSELAIEEFPKKFMEESDEKLKDRL